MKGNVNTKYITNFKRRFLLKNTFMKNKIIYLVISVVILQWSRAQVVLQALESETYQVPNNVTLLGGEYYLASVYDANYLPYTLPTTAATWNTNVNPDASGDIVIDFQGKITSEGIIINLPIKATGAGVLEAGRFLVEVPSEKTQDGIARTLELSWAKTNYNSSTTSIKGIIKSLGGDLNIKKLDVNAGIGNDARGVELVQLNYPSTSSGYQSAYQLRVIAGVPDKFFNEGRPYLYMPVQVEYPNSNYSKVWLNRDTHDKWANVMDLNFNPASVPYTPHTTGGSLDIGDFTKECPTGYRPATLTDFRELKNAAGGNISWLNNPIPNMMAWYPYTRGWSNGRSYYNGPDDITLYLWGFWKWNVNGWQNSLKESTNISPRHHLAMQLVSDRSKEVVEFKYPYKGGYTWLSGSSANVIIGEDLCYAVEYLPGTRAVVRGNCLLIDNKEKQTYTALAFDEKNYVWGDLDPYNPNMGQTNYSIDVGSGWNDRFNGPEREGSRIFWHEHDLDWVVNYSRSNTRRDRCIKE